MKINVKKLNNNQVEIEVEVPSAQMEEYFQLAASELSKDMKVAGFRPGKVPAEIVEKEKGSQKLYDHAANMAIQKTLPKAIVDLPDDDKGEKPEIIGQPDLSVIKIVRVGDMSYKAVFSIMPKIELGKYAGLKIKKEEAKVEEAEIEKSLDYLQKSRGKLITVNRSAKKGDRVEISFTTKSEGKEIEGGKEDNHSLSIGEGRFMPGFEEKIEGMKGGEEAKFSLVAPKDWPQKALAGKKLDFEIKLKIVQEQEIPELSDEFAKSLGKFQSLKELKENVKKGLLEEKEAKEKERQRMKLIEEVVKNSKMDIPDVLVKIELDKMVQELQANIQNVGLTLDKYLGEIKKTIDDLRKEWRPQALERTKVGVILRAIAKKEKIKAEEKEIEERIEDLFKNYPNKEDVKKKVDQEMLKRYTEDVIKNEKVFKLLESEAKII